MRHARPLLTGFLAAVILLALAPAAEAQAPGGWIEITGDNLRVRSGPSTSASILTQVNRGVRARVLDAPDGIDWVKVNFPDSGIEGWVHRDFVRFESAPGGAPSANALLAPLTRFDFAAISRLDGAWIVHGSFPSGLPVLAIEAGQERVYRGTTGASGYYEDEAFGDSFAYVRVAFDAPPAREDRLIAAIVGQAGAYAPISVTPISDSSEIDRIRVESVRRSHELRAQEIESGGLRLAAVYRFNLGENVAHLAHFELPLLGSYAPRPENAFVVLSGEQYWYAYVLCGSRPEIFRAGDTFYMAGRYVCCDCAIVGSFAQSLDAAKSVWHHDLADY